MSGDPQATRLHLAVLLACYNRRETTMRAVRSLQEAPSGLQLTVVLFDDASTDGTADAVLAIRPDTVVVQGDGSAFWNGGLHRAWQAALTCPVDGFLWLNDDVELDDDALACLVRHWRETLAATPDGRFVLVGATRNGAGSVTYGGLRRVPSPFALRFVPVLPADQPRPVETFNGNIVAVPRAVVDAIGINDPAYHHNLGDIDYGLRVSRAGIPVLLMPGTLGICEANTAKSQRGYGSPALGLVEQWRKVNSHHGLPFRSWWHFTARHSGTWRWPHFVIPYRWLVMPRWLRRGAGLDTPR